VGAALQGKAVVITGSGNGIGRAYAHHAAGLGASVVVNDIDTAAADRTAEEIRAAGGQAAVDHSSVAEWDGAASIIDTCVRTFGAIDGLVNNAGVSPDADFWDESEERVRLVVGTNLMGGMFCGIHAARAMRANGGKGSIVNIISATQMGFPKLSIYGATKGGMASYTYCQATDLADTQIRVNAVAPNAKTKMSDDYVLHTTGAVPEYGFAPEENAPLVSYLLSDLSAGITGQAISIRGGQIAIVLHPQFSSYVVDQPSWTVEEVASAFDASLRAGLQSFTAGVAAGTKSDD
jgi:NAD(P)-dependent dehydrogenase (short-subunit alcohol dehydrogenase family)